MEIVKATINDIDVLIEFRIAFLNSEMEVSEHNETIIRNQLRGYFEKHLLQDNFIAILLKLEAEFVASAFLVIQEFPSSLSFLSGSKATLLNVFTYPRFRRKGYAEKVISKAIQEAKSKQVSCIDLLATSDGLSLYRKLKFKELVYPSMRLVL